MDFFKKTKPAYFKKEVIESLHKPKKVVIIKDKKSKWERFIYNPYTTSIISTLIGLAAGYILSENL